MILVYKPNMGPFGRFIQVQVLVRAINIGTLALQRETTGVVASASYAKRQGATQPGGLFDVFHRVHHPGMKTWKRQEDQSGKVNGDYLTL